MGVEWLQEANHKDISLDRRSNPRRCGCLLLVLGEGAYATSGAIALGVLGLISIALSRKKVACASLANGRF